MPSHQTTHQTIFVPPTPKMFPAKWYKHGLHAMWLQALFKNSRGFLFLIDFSPNVFDLYSMQTLHGSFFCLCNPMAKQRIAYFHFLGVYLYIISSIYLFSSATKTKKFTEIILILLFTNP